MALLLPHTPSGLKHPMRCTFVCNTLCIKKKMLLSLCFRATLYTYTYVRPHVVGTKWGHFKLPSITKKQNVEEYYPIVHP